MYKKDQIVETLYQGRWVQAKIVEFPKDENEECFILNCKIAQFIARTTEEIRPVKKYHIMNKESCQSGDYTRGVFLEELYSYENKLAIKTARQYYPSQKVGIFVQNSNGSFEFIGTNEKRE